MNHAEESSKVPKDAKFANLGRAIADRAIAGQPTDRLIEEVRILRHIEQDSASRYVRMASLARLVGDAARTGRDLQPHIDALVELRRLEVSGSARS